MERKKTENNQIPPKKKAPKPYAKKGGNGGVRVGSGRKLGAATKKTREIADKMAADGGLMPLEYLLSVMRETTDDLRAQYEFGTIDLIEYTVKLKEMIKRKDAAAEKAAPYVHARLSSITADVGLRGQDRWISLLAEQEL